MTTDTEALRAQFEKLLSDSGRACRYDGDGQYGYPHDFSWLCYQAGYAAAKAETAEQEQAKQRDAERLDWIIEHRAYVVSDPDCCDGYWLNYARPDGTVWTQATEHETPRAAIDAARGESNG